MLAAGRETIGSFPNRPAVRSRCLSDSAWSLGGSIVLDCLLTWMADNGRPRAVLGRASAATKLDSLQARQGGSAPTGALDG
jgi:hypothetical protein